LFEFVDPGRVDKTSSRAVALQSECSPRKGYGHQCCGQLLINPSRITAPVERSPRALSAVAQQLIDAMQRGERLSDTTLARPLHRWQRDRRPVQSARALDSTMALALLRAARPACNYRLDRRRAGGMGILAFLGTHS
jgi:hypothetical protein